MARDERRELLESLAFDRQGIGVVVLAARDVERELRRGGEPGVGSLLAEHGEDVAEHAAKGVVTHYDNLKRAGERHVGVVHGGVSHERHVRDGEGRRQVQRRVQRVERLDLLAVQRRDDVTLLQLPLGRALRDHARDRHAAALCARADDPEARVTSPTGRDDVGDARDELGRVPEMLRGEHRDDLAALVDGDRVDEVS